MRHQEFVDQMSALWQETDRRLSLASRDKKYLGVPHEALKRLFEKYRNLNFNQPQDSFEMVVVTFGFVQIAVVHRMKERYFAALKAPETWDEVVQQTKVDLNQLADEFIEEIDRETVPPSA